MTTSACMGECSHYYIIFIHSWDIHDADVACKMRNYKSAQSAPREAFFGDGLGVIWFDDFLCSGDEASLLDCSHAGVKVHNCRHSEDASAVCSSKYTLSPFPPPSLTLCVSLPPSLPPSLSLSPSLPPSLYMSLLSLSLSSLPPLPPSLSPVLEVCPYFSQAHGQFSVSDTQFGRYTQGTRVVITCDTGYQPVENAHDITCSNSGDWSPHAPACTRTYVHSKTFVPINAVRALTPQA